jgi:hypothetical protein
MNPTVGTERRRHRFLWWPMRIGSQTRWLEVVTYQERFVRSKTHAPVGRVPAPPDGWNIVYWKPIKWL